MHDAAVIERTRRKFQALTVVMDERMRRQWAATEAIELGWGGISQVAKATGISRTTILAGVRELKAQEAKLWRRCPAEAFVVRAVGANLCRSPTGACGTPWRLW